MTEIHLNNLTFQLTGAGSLHKTKGGYLFTAPNPTLSLPRPPARFYRHGWQSWTLAAWIDPSEPPLPVRAPEFRAKDEDPRYALAKNHVSAWVGAVELDDRQILLLGALGLGGRVELDGASLRGFYEEGYQENQWFVTLGPEDEAFARYASMLEKRFGQARRAKAPRVWCSWYSLYRWINEPVILNVLNGLGDLPFDVVQLDDGWQDDSGYWEPNNKFPSGMSALAAKITATGRIPGIWLSPLLVTPRLRLFREHPDWLLRGEDGLPVSAGLAWQGHIYALDASLPAVLDWLEKLIRKVSGWGFGYLKLDFLYAGALAGKRHHDIPRELAYRNALQVMRTAAGAAYLLACGAPILPSLGLCDGMRIGPDVTPYWLNTPHSVWLNNPNNPSTQNAIRTSLHRLWLRPLVHTDPDVVYFRSRHNRLKPHERALLRDLALICGFKATSDLPQWLTRDERRALHEFLEAEPQIERLDRAHFRVDGRAVDFGPALPLPAPRHVPVPLARNLGLLNMGIHEVLPAVLEVGKQRSSIS